MRFREGVVPPTPHPSLVPGKFYFPQEYPGGITYLSGSGVEELIQSVLSFRSRQGIEIGDPRKEIDLYLCDKFPHLCNPFDTSEPQIAEELPRVEQPDATKRLTAWRSNRYSQLQNGLTVARQDIAEARAQICANCPARQEKPTEGCLPCIAENERVLFILRQGKGVAAQPGLCSITAQDNETAAFMTGDTLSYSNKYEEELRQANASCWLLPESPLR